MATMKVGDFVNDPAWRMSGVIVGKSWIDHQPAGRGDLTWDWLVLYQNGELHGADINDLQVINEAS